MFHHVTSSETSFEGNTTDLLHFRNSILPEQITICNFILTILVSWKKKFLIISEDSGTNVLLMCSQIPMVHWCSDGQVASDMIPLCSGVSTKQERRWEVSGWLMHGEVCGSNTIKGQDSTDRLMHRCSRNNDWKHQPTYFNSAFFVASKHPFKIASWWWMFNNWRSSSSKQKAKTKKENVFKWLDGQLP